METGHEVTLFASGDSSTRAELVAVSPCALRLSRECVDPYIYHTVLLEQVFQRHEEFDLIHLQASLGITVCGTTPSVHFRDSFLPPTVDYILVENLTVGQAKLSLIIRRQAHGVGIDVIRREGEVEVAVLK